MVSGFASLVGTVTATLAINKLKLSLARQLRCVVLLSAVVCLAPLISFALGCKASYGPVTRAE